MINFKVYTIKFLFIVVNLSRTPFLNNCYFHDYFYSIFSVTKPNALEGVYQLNTQLNNAERIFVDKLDGAEMLISRGNIIYATLHTGEVVKIEGEKITKVAQFGSPCSKY